MDMPWGADTTKKFVTNVGLITSNGPHGCDIMACEWTHHISHSPGLIAVSIKAGKATHENITKEKVFGVSLCADDQNVISSIAGGYSKMSVDKIGALKELGFSFSKGKQIDVLMVDAAALNVECKLVETLNLGSHTMFVGEVLEATATEKEPLAFHAGKYFKLDKELQKPSDDERARQKEVVEKHPRDSAVC